MKNKNLLTPQNIVGVALVISIFSACKKESLPSPVAPVSYTVKFATAALEYLNLTPGKYLIYKDSASGSLDSVVVTKSILEGTYVPSITTPAIIGTFTQPEIHGQKFSLVLSKVEANSTIIWFTGIAYTGSGSSNSTDADLVLEETYISSTGDENSNSSAFFYSKLSPTYLIPSITIEGKVYTNVIVGEFENLPDPNDPGYIKRIFYWSKTIGIIKRRIVTPGGKIETHSLLRNN